MLYNLILGSQSPRRRELLAGLDIPFRVVEIEAGESYPPELTCGDIPLYISREKAQAYLPQLEPEEMLITADTIVWLNGKMLGKPKDLNEARRMLHMLSGRTHQVYTGVTFTYLNNRQPVMHSIVDCTDVTFRGLSDKEIEYYVTKYKPLDKAGGYGVQEYIGYIGVKSMTGSYFNVMGFPVSAVYEELKRFGF